METFKLYAEIAMPSNLSETEFGSMDECSEGEGKRRRPQFLAQRLFRDKADAFACR